MKKILVLVLIMLCASVAFGQLTVTVPKGLTGATGSTLNVPVTMSGSTSTYATFQIVIAYDTTVLRITGHTSTGAVTPSNWAYMENKNRRDSVPNAINPNVRWYYLTGYDPQGRATLSGNGKLVDLQFYVKGDANSRSPLTIYNNLAVPQLNTVLDNDAPIVVPGSFGRPYPTTLVAPDDGASLIPRPPKLSWLPAIGAETYRLEVSTSSSFSTYAYVDSTITDTSKTVSGLNEGTLYYWRVRGKNAAGTSEYTDARSFTTEVQVPAVPTLVFPADVATNVTASPTLVWQKVLGATTYYLQISESAAFTGCIVDDSTLTDTTKALSGLARNTMHFWHVRAKGPGGTSAFSATRTFTTQPAGPLSPTLQVPLHNSTSVAIDPTIFAWMISAGATTYHLQISTSETFATTVVDKDTLTGSSDSIMGLLRNTVYYWRVSATNSEGTSPYSTIYKFTTIPEAPTAPTTSTPADGAKRVPVNLNLTWSSVAGATSYHLQVSESQLFGELTAEDSTLTGTSKQVTGLQHNTQYYWRVSAKNDGGISAYSDPAGFKTILATPATVSPADGATDQDTALVLQWTRVPGADTYHLQLSKSSGFATLVVDDSTLSDTSKALPNLDGHTQYYWRVSAKNSDGTSDWASASFTVRSTVGIEQVGKDIPTAYGLSQNYPNPFNPTTCIEIMVPRQSMVTLDVFDVLGHRIATLVNGVKNPGTYRISLDGRLLSSGTYFYTMKAGSFTTTKKFTLMK